MTNTITYLYHSTFFNPVQSPVRMLGLSENHTRLPALLSPVPRRRDARREERAPSRRQLQLPSTPLSRPSTQWVESDYGKL